MKKSIFLSIEAGCYIAFLTIDLFFKELATYSTYIKYISIVICFFFVLTFYEKGYEKREVRIVRLAMFFTLLSDTFLLILDCYAIGVTTFCMVQLLYWYRLRHDRSYENAKVVGLWIAIIILLLVGKVPVDYTLLVVTFYFLLIGRNTIYAARHCKNRYFVMGLILFLLCDINVGLFNCSSYLQLPASIGGILYAASSVLMWTFYLPSQVLLSLSVCKKPQLSKMS